MALAEFAIAHLPRAARAYQIDPERTLEADVADADLVVRGRVEFVDFYDSGTTQARFAKAWCVATVRVAETLKGPRRDSIRFVQESFDRDAKPGRPENAVEALYFLEDGRRLAGRDPEYGRWEWAVGFFSGGDIVPLEDPGPSRAATSPATASARRARNAPAPRPRAITIDLRPLNDRGEILSLTRELCALEPPASSATAPSAGDPSTGRPESKYFAVYRPRDVGLDFSELPLELAIPLDARTEAHARQWALSSHVPLRFQAVQVLRERRSEANARVLRGLLADPAFLETGSGPTRARFYFIRRAAQRALSAWGYKVPPTRVEEAQLGYRPVGARDRAWLAAVVVPGVAAGRLASRAGRRRRRGRARRMGRGLPAGGIAAGAGAAALLTGLWARSNAWGDEIVFEHGARHSLVSYRGWFQYTLCRPWAAGGPGGAVLGSFRLHQPADPWRGAEFDEAWEPESLTDWY